MLRSRAASLYGWDILLAGTAPARQTYRRAGNEAVIRERRSIMRVGLRTSRDHHAGKPGRESSGISSPVPARSSVGCWSWRPLPGQLRCSAVAGWRAGSARREGQREAVRVSLQQRLPRHRTIFAAVRRNRYGTVQIPVTLPPRDEVVGRRGEGG